MSREKIKDWFNGFFEFETEDRSIVTSVSCKFFAEYVFDMQQERIGELETHIKYLMEDCRVFNANELGEHNLRQQVKGAENVIESVLGEPESLTSDALNIRYEFLERVKQLREQIKGGDL